MPERGISFFRLKEHIRKWKFLYVVGLIIVAVLTNLILTMTRPQVPAEKQVLIYVCAGYSDTDLVEPLEPVLLEYGQTQDETLEEVQFQQIQYAGQEDINSAYLLVARMSTGEGDVYLASPEAADYMLRIGIATPLDDAIAGGWLDGLTYTTALCEDEETGEIYTGGIRLDAFTGLTPILNPEGAVMVIAANSTNIETSLTVAERFLNIIAEDENALTTPDQPAA